MKIIPSVFLGPLLLTGLLAFSGCELETGTETPPPKEITGAEKIIAAGETGTEPLSPDIFIGSRWLETASGFVYMFKPDGTVTVEHHCGLVFTDQFSYLVWKNLLLTYGSEMDADTLSYYTLNVQDEENIWAITPSARLIYERNGDDDSGLPADLNYRIQNDLVGVWQAAETVYAFKNDGTYTETAAGGDPVQYSYLVRKDRLVTLSHDTPVVLRDSRYAKGENSLTLYPPAGGNPITLTR
jgi:hypothetical protein